MSSLPASLFSAVRANFKCQRDVFCLDIDLTLPGRGVTALFGPSGSGKTTCLRALAGLDRFPGGYCALGDTVWQDERQQKFMPTYQRNLGMVFQEASLFPHLSILGNLQFGQKRSATAQRIGLEQAIELLGIGHLLKRKPDTLSGGERQRVGIARALAVGPDILLMDEPLAALDHQRKQEILPYLERLHGELDIPMVYVSHAPDEVARLADHLVLLDQGKVVASGPLNDVLSRIDLPDVLRVLGDDAGLVIEASIAEHEADHLTRLEFPGGSIFVAQRSEPVGTRLRCRIHARDVSLALSPPMDSSILNCVSVTVVDVAPTPTQGHVLVKLDLAGKPLLARITQRSADRLGIAAGQPLYAQIKAVALLA